MKTPWDVCPQVTHFKAYEPGLSMEEIRQKYGLKKIVKMASNENPFGVSKKVEESIQKNAINAFRYPQAGNPQLVEKLAHYYSVKYPFITEKNIFLGNGSDEIIDLLFRVRTIPAKHNVVAFNPCFGLYVTQAKFHGCELRQANLKEDLDFDFKALLNLVDDNTSMVFVTSPDNPSGRLAKKEDLIKLAKDLPSGCLLIIDEAYIEFATCEECGDKKNNEIAKNEAQVSLISELYHLKNVAIMRTFSKVYGLAGLRIGYAILPEELSGYLWRVRLPFSLNILAHDAAIIALEDEEYKQKSIAHTTKERVKLFESLSLLGCHVFPSSSNFLMFSLKDNAKRSAKELSTKLLEKGFIIRYLASYGFPNHLRVTVGTEEENTEFISLCKEFLQ